MPGAGTGEYTSTAAARSVRTGVSQGGDGVRGGGAVHNAFSSGSKPPAKCGTRERRSIISGSSRQRSREEETDRRREASEGDGRLFAGSRGLDDRAASAMLSSRELIHERACIGP